MTVAFDAITTSGATVNHAPVGTPRAVIGLLRVNGQPSDVVTGVTYGGVSMTRVLFLGKDAANDGSVYIYFLGSSVPTGNQTMSSSLSAGAPNATCITLTASADCEVVDSDTIDDTASGDLTKTLTLSSRTSYSALCWWRNSGTVTGVTQLTGWTNRGEVDHGVTISGIYTYDTIGSSDISAGVNTASSGPEIIVGMVAVSEVSGSTYTLDAASATYTYTATAADVLHGHLIDAASATYNYTAQDATLTRDMPLIPDSAAYTWTANDASLEYSPVSTYTLNADSAAYTWTATDAGLLHGYAVDADAASYLWTANDASLDYAPLSSQRLTYGAAPHTLDPARVRHKWEEIEEIDRRIAAKQEAEREKIRKQEEAKRQLADLEEKKRQTKTIAERKRKLEARIAAYQSEITELRQAVIALEEQIERMRAEQELQQTIADRRRRMVLLLAAVA